jgi:Sec-independent protein translocase protein TatA
MVIAGVVMLLMGPDKLPEVAQKLGAAWRALKNIQQKIESEVREAIPDLPSTGDIARMARSPVNLLNQLADRADAKDAAANAVTPAEAGVDPSKLLEPPILLTPPPLPNRRTDEPPPFDPSLN